MSKGDGVGIYHEFRCCAGHPLLSQSCSEWSEIFIDLIFFQTCGLPLYWKSLVWGSCGVAGDSPLVLQNLTRYGFYVMLLSSGPAKWQAFENHGPGSRSHLRLIWAYDFFNLFVFLIYFSSLILYLEHFVFLNISNCLYYITWKKFKFTIGFYNLFYYNLLKHSI